MSFSLSARASEFDTHNYNFRQIQTDAGLPDSTINAMAQTPDGYIWCVTFNGLARFDGVRFEVFDPSNTPELPTDRLIKLGVSKSGTLIIVTEFGDVVLFANGRFKRCLCDRSHRNEAIVEDADGRLWASSLRRNVQDWEPLDHAGQGGMKSPLRVVLPLFYTNSGPCIVGGNTLLALDGLGLRKATGSGPWEQMDSPLPGGERPSALAVVAGGAWLTASNAWCFFDGTSIKRKIFFGPEGYGRGIFCDEGPQWVVHDRARLARVDLQAGVLKETVELPEPEHASINIGFIDREKNLWVGEPGQGLFEVRRLDMQRFTTREGLSSDIVRSVAEDSAGNVWAVTTGGINIISGQQVKKLPPSQSLAIPWNIIPAQPGGMWLGTYSSGLYRYTQEQWHRVFELHREGWDAPDFLFLLQDSMGMLWFGNAGGLFCFDGTNVIALPLPVDRKPDIRAVAEAGDGTLYAGSDGSGLFVRHPRTKAWKRLTAVDGLHSEQIYSLHTEPDGMLWVGTSGAGLARFDGRRFVFFRELLKELPRTVTGMVSDERGYLWIGSGSGIFRARLADLNALAEDASHPVSVTEYGPRAGLVRTESNVGIQPSILKAHDGRIWVATTGGVVSFDPKKIPSNPLPPPVVLERVVSGQSQIDLAAHRAEALQNRQTFLSLSAKSPDTLTVQAGADPVEFEFTGLSFTAPEGVQFRYRMEGLEPKWTHTQERHALYQRLPPGHYTFHVTACNNDGVWNNEGAALAVVQLPFYWETNWFKAAIAAAVAGILYMAYRFRVAQLARVSRLRARIAADLHDEVGSNLGAVVLNSDLLTMSPNLAPSEREQVEDIHRIARNTAHAIREISWFINPDFDFLDEMIARMKEAAGRLSKNHEVRFCAPKNPPKTRLDLDFRRNVMALYKESLNNAARHSGAKHIDISVGVEVGRMELLICDDGRGFALGQEHGGQGLRNLRQRADAVNGTLELKSSPGNGTCVKFSVAIR